MEECSECGEPLEVGAEYPVCEECVPRYRRKKAKALEREENPESEDDEDPDNTDEAYDDDDMY